MKTQFIEFQAFGPISSFIELYQYTHIFLEQYEYFQKMSFRNRFQLLKPDGIQNMSVPIKGGRDKMHRPMMEVAINYEGKWMQEHARTLQTLYNNSPFFYHYQPAILALYNKQFTYLWEFCQASLAWVLQELQWEGQLGITNSYAEVLALGGIDCRNLFKPNNRHQISIPPYSQVFGSGFTTNLSILDLLFNMGPESVYYLQNAAFLDTKKG